MTAISGICPYCEEVLLVSEPCQVLDPPHEGFYHEECAIALLAEDENATADVQPVNGGGS